MNPKKHSEIYGAIFPVAIFTEVLEPKGGVKLGLLSRGGKAAPLRPWRPWWNAVP